jgi:hypothetical protein
MFIALRTQLYYYKKPLLNLFRLHAAVWPLSEIRSAVPCGAWLASMQHRAGYILWR